MTLDIRIATGSTVPIYRQIMDRIRKAVAEGDLPVGEQLPSVRTLAETLLVNPNTVARAYSELVRDGVLESRHGRGVFAARRRQVYTRAERLRRLERALDAFVSEAVLLDFDRKEILEAVKRRFDGSQGEGPSRGDMT